MRMMLKVSIPVETGNKAIKDGTLPRTIESTVDRLKPEAAYFFAEDGKRTALFFFNMADASQIPAIVEPLFMGLNAAVTTVPVMNADDLKKGLTEAAKNF
ncbi:MAG: hypothetical protein A3G76_13970 [Acidobacteria bacterium RIFCSPLOWO2_12_FULL_65_11]|nr:MAG: hypothetical protein A3H95_09905 [Acidobacteria bacterium RIFCSPLOWO2_02_FULL_64_15]OFW28758.1 MAG: hypothetical protein A3G76_13970 [Acidobacteria bacterium RIFCSPLOWO2_12_FULL_65_11]